MLEIVEKLCTDVGIIARGRLVHQAVMEEVRKAFEGIVYETHIPRSIAVAESQSFEKPLIEYDPNGKAAQAYKAMAEEFLRRQPK